MPRFLDYTTEILIGSTSMEIGLDYTYERGLPATRYDPGEGPSCDFSAIYWRSGDEWREADPALHDLLIEAMGGDEQMQEDLIAHANGRAEEDACERADMARDMVREDR